MAPLLQEVAPLLQEVAPLLQEVALLLHEETGGEEGVGPYVFTPII